MELSLSSQLHEPPMPLGKLDYVVIIIDRDKTLTIVNGFKAQ